ncbi:MAG: 30S ribosomal protein S9 [Nanoarchaeota archaeon]
MVKAVLKTGRRKTAVARAVLKKGKGEFYINNQKHNSYVSNNLLQLKLNEPLILADSQNKYDIKVNVLGGGQNSQVDAIRQAIAKALIEITQDDNLKKKMLEYDRSLLVTDTRFKEMYKPGNSKARSKRQKSYR